MLTVMLQMALLVAAGSFWQRLAPSHIPALAHRRALTDLVFYILLPALVLDVLWRAPLDHTSAKISLVALSGLATGALAMWLMLKFRPATRAQQGALMLAATFPNVTYLGLPVLNQVLGDWSHSIVLQYDLFACTPVLMTLGILLAHHYGSTDLGVHPLKELTRVPPLWAVAVAMTLNYTDIPQPESVHSVLSVLSGGVVPLMLIALGMSIRWESLRLRFMSLLLPVVLISLLLVPGVVMLASQLLAIPDGVDIAVILLAAMPTMVFGIVICERYGLDTVLYAAAVTLTTLCSIVTLTLWYQLLS